MVSFCETRLKPVYETKCETGVGFSFILKLLVSVSHETRNSRFWTSLTSPQGGGSAAAQEGHHQDSSA